jgi:hypothetical protein
MTVVTLAGSAYLTALLVYVSAKGALGLLDRLISAVEDQESLVGKITGMPEPKVLVQGVAKESSGREVTALEPPVADSAPKPRGRAKSSELSSSEPEVKKTVRKRKKKTLGSNGQAD